MRATVSASQAFGSMSLWRQVMMKVSMAGTSGIIGVGHY